MILLNTQSDVISTTYEIWEQFFVLIGIFILSCIIVDSFL